jgi:hypothetical protein
MSIKLSNPYLERDAIRAPNFFNGRLLSAEDLAAERAAVRRRLEQLGRCHGDGIAYGLEVRGAIGGSTTTEPVVSVSAGLAVNRLGQAIELNQSVDVSLLQPTPTEAGSATNQAGAFSNCSPLLSGSAYVAGEGIYLLTVAPVEGREGRAPASGLGNLTVCCGDKSLVFGVKFRLLRVSALDGLLSDGNRLRNAVAYRCFGSPELAFATNPFADQGSYGLVDSLRPAQLSDGEVPLAMIHWTSTGGTRFVDGWCVRRRLLPAPIVERTAMVAGDRRRAEGEARLMQFQDQVSALAGAGAYDVGASSVFRFLPAAGILPLSGIGASLGFDRLKFFADQTWSGPAVIEGTQLSALVERSFHFPPIDLQSHELIWTYLVRENLQAAASGTPAYFVFSSGHLPYLGDARADIARANFSNVTLT